MECCEEYDKQVAQLNLIRGELSAPSQAILDTVKKWINGQREQHVDEAGEASWNAD